MSQDTEQKLPSPKKGLIIDKDIRHHFTESELKELIQQNQQYQKALEAYRKLSENKK